MMETQGGMWQLFVTGVEGKTIVINVSANCKVDQLQKEVCSYTGIPEDAVRLVYGVHQLEFNRNKDLQDYKIGDHATLHLLLRLLGGWNPLQALRIKKKEIKPLPPFITLTTSEPDMITFDDNGEPRAKMPCGHVIGPYSMTEYCLSLLSEAKCHFLCPHVDSNGLHCNREWPYYLVRHVAVLSPDEQKEFETKIGENYMRKSQGIHQCPGCDTFCMRIDPSKNAVRCPLCTKKCEDEKVFDFCWICSHEWGRSASDNTCGNPTCNGLDPRLKYLKLCATATIGSVASCLSLRACPNCGIMIEYKGGCKHMTCAGCNHHFCFVCLKPPRNGKWQCGSYSAKCVSAPIQTKLPGHA